MPTPLLHAIKEMHQDDTYILVNGDKRACVHPTNGVKQGFPLAPPLSFYTSMTWAKIPVKG
eukprot:1149958-Pelagomonas_calceolata.AAC.4